MNVRIHTSLARQKATDAVRFWDDTRPEKHKDRSDFEAKRSNGGKLPVAPSSRSVETSGQCTRNRDRIIACTFLQLLRKFVRPRPPHRLWQPWQGGWGKTKLSLFVSSSPTISKQGEKKADEQGNDKAREEVPKEWEEGRREDREKTRMGTTLQRNRYRNRPWDCATYHRQDEANNEHRETNQAVETHGPQADQGTSE